MSGLPVELTQYTTPPIAVISVVPPAQPGPLVSTVVAPSAVVRFKNRLWVAGVQMPGTPPRSSSQMTSVPAKVTPAGLTIFVASVLGLPPAAGALCSTSSALCDQYTAVPLTVSDAAEAPVLATSAAWLATATIWNGPLNVFEWLPPESVTDTLIV